MRMVVTMVIFAHVGDGFRCDGQDDNAEAGAASCKDTSAMFLPCLGYDDDSRDDDDDDDDDGVALVNESPRWKLRG